MQTHEDSDATEQKFLRRLKERADAVAARGGSQITSGAPGELVLREWAANGVNVRQLPDDEQGILRVSIGGKAAQVDFNYSVFRGDREACIKLLRSALVAMEHKRGD